MYLFHHRFSHTYFFATCISNFFFSSYLWCSFSFTNVASLLLTDMVCPIAILCQEKVWNKKKIKINNPQKINNTFIMKIICFLSPFIFKIFFFSYAIFLHDIKTKSAPIQWNISLCYSSTATAGSDKKGGGCMQLLLDLLCWVLHRQLCHGMANEQAKRSQKESESRGVIYQHYHQRKRRECMPNTFRDLFHSPNNLIWDFQMYLKFHQSCSNAFFLFFFF